MTYLAIFMALLLWVQWQLHLHLGRYRLLRSRRQRGLSAELRCRDFLIAPHHDAFPEPREERLVVWRVLGCVVYLQRRSVALPSQCDARIGSIAAGDFDARFDHGFRLTAW